MRLRTSCRRHGPRGMGNVASEAKPYAPTRTVGRKAERGAKETVARVSMMTARTDKIEPDALDDEDDEVCWQKKIDKLNAAKKEHDARVS